MVNKYSHRPMVNKKASHTYMGSCLMRGCVKFNKMYKPVCIVLAFFGLVGISDT